MVYFFQQFYVLPHRKQNHHRFNQRKQMPRPLVFGQISRRICRFLLWFRGVNDIYLVVVCWRALSCRARTSPIAISTLDARRPISVREPTHQVMEKNQQKRSMKTTFNSNHRKLLKFPGQRSDCLSLSNAITTVKLACDNLMPRPSVKLRPFHAQRSKLRIS